MTPLPAGAPPLPAYVGEGAGSHHGQLRLQLLHPVVLEVQLGAQCCGVVRGLLGLAPQLPLLALQQVLLLSQSFHSILAFLRGEGSITRGMAGANLWPGDAQRPLTPGLAECVGVRGVPHARALEKGSPGFKPVSATH